MHTTNMDTVTTCMALRFRRKFMNIAVEYTSSSPATMGYAKNSGPWQ